MGLKVYLSLALLAFLTATMGADVVARTTIAGETVAFALRDHIYWAGVQFVGTLLLLAPFVAVAFICARVEKKARHRSAFLIFALAMLTLLYFYFDGHMAAQHALKGGMWTAAALSVGLLPFFIGIPLLLAAIIAGAFATKFDRRMSD